MRQNDDTLALCFGAPILKIYCSMKIQNVIIHIKDTLKMDTIPIESTIWKNLPGIHTYQLLKDDYDNFFDLIFDLIHENFFLILLIVI